LDIDATLGMLELERANKTKAVKIALLMELLRVWYVGCCASHRHAPSTKTEETAIH